MLDFVMIRGGLSALVSCIFTLLFYGQSMSATTTVKTWEKTNLQNMVRHKSGGYYARLFLNGKEIWKSLKTKHFTIAKSRLADAVKEHRQRIGREESVSCTKMTFKHALDLHLQHLEEKVSIKRRTRAYWKEVAAAILKSWPELAETEVRRITVNSCREWAARHAKSVSPTRYNNAVAFLRHVFALAVENGVVFSNVADRLEKKSVRPKKLELPTLQQFTLFVSEIRAGKGCFAHHCANLVQGLAFTGCRISEAARIEWQDVDFTAGEILIKGDPEEATKNGEIRRIPMIPSALALFEQLSAARTTHDKHTVVFGVINCQKAMNRAAEKIEMARITHHDLRHFFATVCIESGVDIPTVSRWLGHKDGGALAMRTYGHLRREHSQSQALKVSFLPA
jgi:integrase